MSAGGRGTRRVAVFSPLAMAAVVVFNLWHLLGGPALAFWGIAVWAAVFVYLERGAIPRSIRVISLILTGLAVLAWPFGGATFASIERGVYIGAMISSVMASVALLARAALRSPGLQTLVAYLEAQHYRRRYVLLAIASQVLPCMLGFAGVHMLLSVAARGHNPDERHRIALFTVIARSFSAATLWSPTFGNMVILLALYPQLAWSTVLPVGLAMAALSILASMAIDHRLLRAGRPAGEAPEVPAGVRRATVVTLGAMLVFFTLVLTLSNALEIPVSGGIAMLAPVAAFVMHVALAERGHPVRAAWQGVLKDGAALRGFAPEVLLFMAAGCGGTVIADSIPREWIAVAAGHIAGHPTLAVLALMCGVITLSCIGVHPVLSAVLLASTFTPQALQLPVLPHFAALLAGWSIASTVAPFSMLNMTASRQAGVGLYRISLRHNGVYALGMTLLVAAGLTLLAWGLNPA